MMLEAYKGQPEGYVAWLEKQLKWFASYEESVSATHNVHDWAVEFANEVNGVRGYPFEEGDDYWSIEVIDEEVNSVRLVESCWDDQSEEMYDAETSELYATIGDAIRSCVDRYDVLFVHRMASPLRIPEYHFDTERGKFYPVN